MDATPKPPGMAIERYRPRVPTTSRSDLVRPGGPESEGSSESDDLVGEWAAELGATLSDLFPDRRLDPRDLEWKRRQSRR
jgi:hypothetical protein